MMYAHRFWYVFRFRSCAVGVKGLITATPTEVWIDPRAGRPRRSGVRSREVEVRLLPLSHDLRRFASRARPSRRRRWRGTRGRGGEGSDDAARGRRERERGRDARGAGARVARPPDGRPRRKAARRTGGTGARRKGARRAAEEAASARRRARPRARRDNCRAHGIDAMCAEGADACPPIGEGSGPNTTTPAETLPPVDDHTEGRKKGEFRRLRKSYGRPVKRPKKPHGGGGTSPRRPPHGRDLCYLEGAFERERARQPREQPEKKREFDQMPGSSDSPFTGISTTQNATFASRVSHEETLALLKEVVDRAHALLRSRRAPRIMS